MSRRKDRALARALEQDVPAQAERYELARAMLRERLLQDGELSKAGQRFTRRAIVENAKKNGAATT